MVDSVQYTDLPNFTDLRTLMDDGGNYVFEFDNNLDVPDIQDLPAAANAREMITPLMDLV